MSERPEELQDRLSNIHEIGQVVSALRVIATGHQAQARAALAAARAHAETISNALARALALGGQLPDLRGAAPVSVVVGAEQGFSGAYPDKLAEAAMEEARSGARVVVLGSRTLAAVQAMGLTPLWSDAMPASLAGVAALADRLTDAIFDLKGLDQLRAIHAVGDSTALSLVARPILPPKPPEFRDGSLHLTLTPAALIEALIPETVFATLCEVLLEGIAAENAARSAAMAGAQSNIRHESETLTMQYHEARQDQMTSELLELFMPGTADGA